MDSYEVLNVDLFVGIEVKDDLLDDVNIIMVDIVSIVVVNIVQTGILEANVCIEVYVIRNQKKKDITDILRTLLAV